MEPLASRLRALGHDPVVVTLPGHGTDLDDLRSRSWADWLAAIPPADVLVGQSMGAALCLAFAARRDTAAGSPRIVVAINCPAPDPDAVEGLEWRISRGHDIVDGPSLAEGEVGYSQLPLSSLLEMTSGILTTDLASVTARVVLVSSAHDDVVDPASADLIADDLPTSPERVHLENSGHVATLGPELDVLVDVIDRAAR